MYSSFQSLPCKGWCGFQFAVSTAATVLSLMVLSPPVCAAEPAGMVKTLKGSAEIERDGKRLPVSVGTELFPKDRISTGSNSSVGVTLKDNTQLSAGANAQLELNKFSFNTTSHAGELDTSVKRGALSVISGKVAKANPDAVRFNTGTVTLGVRGTEFIIEAGDE